MIRFIIKFLLVLVWLVLDQPLLLAQQFVPVNAAMSSIKFINEMMKRSGVPGVGMAIAKEGRFSWSEGFGLSDLERQVAATKQTKFGLGSISKSLTMALAMRLQEEKLFDIDAPLEQYLSEFPFKGKGITARLIGCHLSGLDDSIDAATRNTSTTYSASEALKLLYGEKLKYGLRERSHYTTGPFTLIAGAMEQATGKPYTELMQHYVTQPLKMNDTVLNVRRDIIPNRTCFYMRENNQTRHAPYADPSYKHAGAGYLSTADDMVRFGSALLNPGFLRAESLENLFRAEKTMAGDVTPFALGWRVVKDRAGRDMYVQPGGGHGVSSVLAIFPKEKIVIAILSNQTGAPVGQTLLEGIFNAFTER
ncbi:MAG: beta-lactamase family protein [Planctomycetia bacterium]|nr:beta-lactamase family protein [Planctomycetia bacterium]